MVATRWRIRVRLCYIAISSKINDDADNYDDEPYVYLHLVTRQQRR